MWLKIKIKGDVYMDTEKKLVLVYLKNNILLKKDTLKFPTADDLKDYMVESSKYLGKYDGDKFFINSYKNNNFDEKIFETVDMNTFKWNFGSSKSKVIASGEHIHRWYKKHRYCGKCGLVLKEKEDERALQCESCNTIYFPENFPAIIVLIKNKNKILLARNVDFPEKKYSLIAGYIDVGENAEEAVRREVMEEVGLKVKNIEYYGTQSWPFTSTLMIGFCAECDGNDKIKVDGIEIVDANWYDKDFDIEIPTEGTIAGKIIRNYFDL